ncbi:hypothetical protein N431DRAFT_472903 [Stipitochalara longipes BDJ]|nr:hypothetical protein N431DRAFT_472903 [Stipitochalara longipes BDJ]
MLFTACLIVMGAFLRETNAMVPKIVVSWAAPSGSFFTNFSANLLVPQAYQGGAGTVSILTGLTKSSSSVELLMSYLSGNESSQGWYAHEESVFYDHHNNGQLNDTIYPVGGNNFAPVGGTFSSEFDFEGAKSGTSGPSYYQVEVSFDPSAAGSGNGDWQTSPGISFPEVVMGIVTTGNATWNWGPTVWSDVTMTVNTADLSWCTQGGTIVGAGGREYNFQTSVNGNSSTCKVETVELYPY